MKDDSKRQEFLEKVAALCNEHRMAITLCDMGGEISVEPFWGGDRIGQRVYVECGYLCWDVGTEPKHWHVGRWERPDDWDVEVVADRRVEVEPIPPRDGQIAHDREVIAWAARGRFVTSARRWRGRRRSIDTTSHLVSHAQIETGALVAHVGGRHDPTG